MVTLTHAHPRSARRTGFFATVRLAYDAWRSRRALAALEDTALRDIGLTRDEAQAEANRPIWDVPSNWRA